MKNSVRFVSVILIILIFSLSFSVHASPLEQGENLVSEESTLQPEQYSDEILLAYEELCGFIEKNQINTSVSIEEFYESYMIGNYDSMDDYLVDCRGELLQLKAQAFGTEALSQEASTFSSAPGSNARWYYNTGTSPSQKPNYSKYNLLNIVKAGDMVYEGGNGTVGHIVIVEGIYYNPAYSQYYIRVIESIGYSSDSSSDGQASGVCRGILDDDRFEDRIGTIMRLKDDYWDETVIDDAISFCISQIGKPYSIGFLSHGYSSNQTEWYCSQLVWAAYYNQGVNIEDDTGVSIVPDEFLNSSKLRKIVDTDDIQEVGTPSITSITSTSNTSVTINWSAVSGASLYHVYRAFGANGTYTEIATTTSRSYVDNSVSEGSTYCYKISADVSGRRTNTSEVRGIRTEYTAPFILSISATYGDKVFLHWTAVSGAEQYHIYRSTSASGNYIKYKTLTGLTYTDTDVGSGITYYYKVKADNGETLTDASIEKTITPYAVSTPSIYYGKSLTSGKITIKWTFSLHAVSYKIYRSTSSSSGYTLCGTAVRTEFVDTNAPVNQNSTTSTRYYYKIVAVGIEEQGESGYSSYKVVTAT